MFGFITDFIKGYLIGYAVTSLLKDIQGRKYHEKNLRQGKQQGIYMQNRVIRNGDDNR